jgi:polyferredoxin
VVVFLFAMMTAMLLGALIYLVHPARASLVEALWVASAIMSVSVFPVISLFVRDARAKLEGGSSYRPVTIRRRWLFGLAVLAFVVVNEFLMGWTFQLAAGSVALPSAGAAGATLVQGVNSPWFLFPMALEMGLSALLLRALLPRAFVGLLLGQAVVMFLSPPAFTQPGAVPWVIGLASAGMIGIIVFLMEYLYRHRQLPRVLSSYVLGLMAIYALMMAGLYLWLVEGEGLLFALAVLLEMALFFDAVVRPERFAEPSDAPWQLRPNWTFGVLAAIFVSELFMGAVLDLALEPAVYGAAFPALPLSGGGSTILYNAFYNGFWFIAAVCGSTWFLAMMGVEMGALVVFKIRETGSVENKVRMGLMLGCYALFATFFPSVYYSQVFPSAPTGTAVPVLGWSMGLGSAPIVPALFVVIVVTYVVFGSLSALFGRRVVCSVFCTAPLMYQGTTIDAMKSFNRTSTPARKYLGTRFSTLYSTTTGVTMASLAAVSVLSYSNQVGFTSLSILGADPSVFFFALSFSVLWYLMFVTIPYAGNYNCVTMGWCYTGTIAAAFQKIGFFKLKVRDTQVCWDCTTLDCAKGCPVGLVDMVGQLRQTGEFRSTKCCGVGDCVEVCPHDNLYISDVRHSVRRLMGRAETRARRPASSRPAGRRKAATGGGLGATPGGTLLPLVRTKPHAHASSSARGFSAGPSSTPRP